MPSIKKAAAGGIGAAPIGSAEVEAQAGAVTSLDAEAPRAQTIERSARAAKKSAKSATQTPGAAEGAEAAAPSAEGVAFAALAPAKKTQKASSKADEPREENAHTARPEDSNAEKPVVDPMARIARVPAEPTEPITPAASETTQVSKNLSETAAKAAARKPAPAVAAAPLSEAKGPKFAVSSSKAASAAAKAKSSGQKLGFKLNEHIVYPAHGVGQIVGIEVQEVAGFSLELFVVSFAKDKMTLKVPTSKVAAVGMRKLAEAEVVEKALSTLSGRARVKRTMWSRRAQEYEAKINSGDLVTIAEVVRDLYRSDTQPEQSYSERQLYEAALDRMGREVAAVRKLIDSEALKVIESFLAKSPRRASKAEADLSDDGPDEDAEAA